VISWKLRLDSAVEVLCHEMLHGPTSRETGGRYFIIEGQGQRPAAHILLKTKCELGYVLTRPLWPYGHGGKGNEGHVIKPIALCLHDPGPRVVANNGGSLASCSV
jgi:hypothetical protein